MATYSSILAWKIPWPEEPVRLESRGRKKLDTAEWLSMHPTLNLLSPFPAPPHPLTHHRSYLQAHPSVYMCRHFPLFRQVRRQRSPLLCRADIFSAFLLITSWSQWSLSLPLLNSQLFSPYIMRPNCESSEAIIQSGQQIFPSGP